LENWKDGKMEKWNDGLSNTYGKTSFPKSDFTTGNGVPSKPVPWNSARRLAHAHKGGRHNNTLAVKHRLKNVVYIVTFHCYAQ